MVIHIMNTYPKVSSIPSTTLSLIRRGESDFDPYLFTLKVFRDGPLTENAVAYEASKRADDAVTSFIFRGVS